MRKSTIDIIFDRIQIADKESPIAVVHTVIEDEESGEMKPTIKGVFAQTVKTQEMIEVKHPDLIGVFYGASGVQDFKDCIGG